METNQIQAKPDYATHTCKTVHIVRVIQRVIQCCSHLHTCGRQRRCDSCSGAMAVGCKGFRNDCSCSLHLVFTHFGAWLKNKQTKPQQLQTGRLRVRRFKARILVSSLCAHVALQDCFACSYVCVACDAYQT